ncbi:MAG: RluA family pseudouridine synthase [Lachnospiraceae bacterium]|nr:RluA family pseudouridine synthase [Lachnospiraceae bacterium]
MNLNILFMDKDIAVVEKPAGIAVESGRIDMMDLENLLKNQLIRDRSCRDLYLGTVHRLDQPVRGLIVFALSKKAAGDLSRQIREGIFNKRYEAVVEGIIENRDRTVLSDHIKKDKGNIARITDREEMGAKKAVLAYTVKDTDVEKKLTLLEIELITGRFHQIRAQLSHMGYPIAGDKKYGAGDTDNPLPKGAIGLCAVSLSFNHPVTGKRMDFDLSPPYKPEDRHLHKSGIFYTIL